MKIFISGIGGTGLGPLAELALDVGIEVFGSDQKHSPNTDELEKRGVKIAYEQSFTKIREIYEQEKFNWFIASSAIPENSEELKFVRENKIRNSKRDEFLAEFIREKNLNLVAIAGTHGKTTTTSMLIWIFRELGIPVSYSVGSTLKFGPAAQFDENSRFFIYEADEYDRNFLAYSPQISAIVSLDYDHADIYPTIENYRDAFREFIANSAKTLLWKSTFEQLFSDENPAENLVILSSDSDDFSRNSIDLPGAKIRENAFLSLAICREILDDFEENENKIREILAQFPGANRRFEEIFRDQKSGGILISDYAHAPAEIATTLEKAREIVNENFAKNPENSRKTPQKIVAIYQPHQNARQLEIVREGGYLTSFSEADEIFWLPTYLNRMDLFPGAPEILAPEKLISTLEENSRKVARAAEFDENLAEKIRENLRGGNLVIALGAGPIDGWMREKFAKKR